MMDLIRILGCGICVLVLAGALKQYHATAALLVSAAGCIVILETVLKNAVPVLASLRELIQLTENEYLGCVLKCCAITFITQGMVDFCMQEGQRALAGRITLAGKAAILVAASPMIRSFAETVILLLR